MKDKNSTRVEVAQALKDGRIRTALIVNAEGIVVQPGEHSSPDGWVISQEVPDDFVEYIEQNPGAIEASSSVHLVHPTIAVLSITFHTVKWQHFTLLPLLGDTVIQLLRASVSSANGLRIHFNADDGNLAIQLPFDDAEVLRKALAVAELRGSSTVMGLEPLLTIFAAHNQQKYGRKAPEAGNEGERQVIVAAAVELPETAGAHMVLQRAVGGEPSN